MSNETINKEQVANDFHDAFKNVMPETELENAKRGLLATSTSYPANGSVASMIFWLRFRVDIKNGGKTFIGDAGGISTPGGGALFGDVYTDDLERLYRDTVSFSFVATSVYTTLQFFDGNSNLLGHFQSGSVSTTNGTGGGRGSWS